MVLCFVYKLGRSPVLTPNKIKVEGTVENKGHKFVVCLLVRGLIHGFYFVCISDLCGGEDLKFVIVIKTVTFRKLPNHANWFSSGNFEMG